MNTRQTNQIMEDGYSSCFQPVFDFKKGQQAGYEILLKHDRLDNSTAIRRAVDRNFIQTIDSFSAQSAFAVGVDYGLINTKSFLSFNCSILSLLEPQYMDFLVELSEIQPPNGNMIVEFTETEFLRQDEYYKIVDPVYALKEAGYRIAIDDFGVGHSALRMLRLLPVDHVKFGHDVIADLTEHQAEDIERRFKIMKLQFSMIKDLGIKITLEGIETEAHLDLADFLQPDFVQGYYYSKPFCLDELHKTELASNFA